MAEADKEHQLQAMAAELEQGKARLDAIGKQARLAESSILEIQATQTALDSIATTSEGTEILIPLGGDSYVKVNLADNKNVLVGIGSRFSMEKPIKDAKETISQRKDELEKSFKTLQEAYADLSGQLMELNAHVERFLSEVRK